LIITPHYVMIARKQWARG